MERGRLAEEGKKAIGMLAKKALRGRDEEREGGWRKGVEVRKGCRPDQGKGRQDSRG